MGDTSLGMQRKVLLLLGLLTVASFLLGTFLLNRDHSWGDDFAGYILQAQSIAGGSMREYVAKSSFTMEQSFRVIGPVTYPWGFPLLLAPVYAFFGLKVLALKLVSTLLYAMFVVAFFLLARTRLRAREALVLTAVFAFNPALLQAQNEILADIPFLFFSTLALWLIERFANEGARDPIRLGPALAIGCAIFLAAFIRGNGLVLLLGLITAQCLQLLRRLKEHRGLHPSDLPALVPYATLAALYLAQATVFPSVAFPLRDELGGATAMSVWRNMQFYFWLPADMFKDLLQGSSLIFLVLLICFLVQLSRGRLRDLPILAYSLGTLGLYILWPPTQGLRYIFPLLPFFLMLSYEGMQLIASSLKRILPERARIFVLDLWVGLALLSLAASIQLAWTNMAADRYVDGRSYGAFSPGSRAMFEYIQEKTPADSVIIFFKPRAMRLLTDRDSFSTTHCQDLSNGNYVAVVKSIGRYDQISPAEVPHCNPGLTLTPFYEKDDFIVYQIAAAP